MVTDRPTISPIFVSGLSADGGAVVVSIGASVVGEAVVGGMFVHKCLNCCSLSSANIKYIMLITR